MEPKAGLEVREFSGEIQEFHSGVDELYEHVLQEFGQELEHVQWDSERARREMLVQKLFRRGLSDTEIAEQIRCEKQLVASTRQRLRLLRRPPFLVIRRKEVRRLVGLRLSDEDVAKILKCKPTTIGRIRRRELNLPDNMWEPIRTSRIESNFNFGLTDEEIAKKMTIEPDTVKQIRHAFGWYRFKEKLAMRTKPRRKKVGRNRISRRKVVKLIEEGCTDEEIAGLLNYDFAAVRSICMVEDFWRRQR